MRIGIMQPYFFPYIGYFQLISAVDKFVVYDDVNFIKQGWITRNRILLDSRVFLFILKTEGASSFRKINEINIGKNNEKLLKTFEYAYKKAPFFKKVFPLMEEIILNDEKNLAKYLEFSLRKISSYLGMNKAILISSSLEKNKELKAQEKVIEICKKLDGKTYINAIGGQELYSKERFAQEGLELKFLNSTPAPYKQFYNEFIPNLSMVDVMMFNSTDDIQKMLNQYELI